MITFPKEYCTIKHPYFKGTYDSIHPFRCIVRNKKTEKKRICELYPYLIEKDGESIYGWIDINKYLYDTLKEGNYMIDDYVVSWEIAK